MAWLSYNEVFYSLLPPAEVLRQLQASLLPDGEPTWRDDYRPAAEYLFQGSITGNTVEVLRYNRSRVPTSRPVRPFPVQGEVWAAAAGSCIKLRIGVSQETELSLRVALVLALILILAASITYWVHRHAFFFLWDLVTAMGTLATFWLAITSFNLRQETVIARPLLVKLLQLYTWPYPD